MNRPKAFCEECRRDVNYTIAEMPMTGTLREEEYHYTGKEARCPDCGNAIYVPDLNDSNLTALYNAYRQKNGIVALDIIRAVPEKYAIGKRPLSLLLGWGEQTYSRYYDGDMPTRQYSDTIFRIYAEPLFYSELLESNKRNLKSALTYEKSRRAVDLLLAQNAAMDSKIDSVIQYLLNQCEDITPLALQKALYYIQGFYYAFYKTFLFSEDCQAWMHGPVYKDIYYRYRDYRFDAIEKVPDFDASGFSSGEKAIYDSVINNICCYSGKILEKFTHNESPWLITRGNLPVSAPSCRIMKKDLIGSYFEAVHEKYHMVNPCDIRRYAQQMFADC